MLQRSPIWLLHRVRGALNCLSAAVGIDGTRPEDTVIQTLVAAAEGALFAAVAHRWLLALTITHDLNPGALRKAGVVIRIAVGPAHGLEEQGADAIRVGLAAGFTWHSASDVCWCADLQACAIAAEVAIGTALLHRRFLRWAAVLLLSHAATATRACAASARRKLGVQTAVPTAGIAINAAVVAACWLFGGKGDLNGGCICQAELISCEPSIFKRTIYVKTVDHTTQHWRCALWSLFSRPNTGLPHTQVVPDYLSGRVLGKALGRYRAVSVTAKVERCMQREDYRKEHERPQEQAGATRKQHAAHKCT
jgi:hypothetical protein